MGPQITVKEQLFNLNFGPQHPSAHGVLRLILQLSGERILQADAHIGLLHRGTEKLLESRSYEKGLGYFDRLDYVSMMAQEHAFTVVVERLLNTSVATPTNLIRILFLELTRLLNHILSITTHAMDVGAFTPFLWGFEEREKIMEFYERVSGARMHALFIRPRFAPGHLSKSLERTAVLAPLMAEIHQFAEHMDSRISELAMLLSTNRIWCTRLHQVGYVSKDTALSWGFSGPLLRGSGVPWDLRKATPYSYYNDAAIENFFIPCSPLGDSYGRYLIRIEEMRQSLRIIRAVTELLLNLCFRANFTKRSGIGLTAQGVPLELNSMEGIIFHFRSRLEDTDTDGCPGFCYSAVEAPKGEFGVLVWQHSSHVPHRCRIRAPGFAHLQGITFMAIGHLLADAVTIIGTQDIVFGEVDR